MDDTHRLLEIRFDIAAYDHKTRTASAREGGHGRKLKTCHSKSLKVVIKWLKKLSLGSQFRWLPNTANSPIEIARLRRLCGEKGYLISQGFSWNMDFYSLLRGSVYSDREVYEQSITHSKTKILFLIFEEFPPEN